ncbi:TPA: HPP family protein [Vibrio parahaemolyticus]|uniref:HPP family protein n=1 Tax=Vibrio parahaemolyticus TaxID=670 RepID=UPI0007A010B2|nr:HPP family protein [Vibrio parahaemolyticus]EGR1141821.1 HPP family protein [Vibrio parahaemolyticus]EGR2357487.1 HPP family protein [Vibrio parahaemolyticus]EGR3424317.1 HPP family protein [Vibrio parahaemolyticus]ELB1648373.1 HPP family protein [Vibrio parahaemolyticus]ELU1677992.1 HPP family protein [Vibrio parahaemolyticus]
MNNLILSLVAGLGATLAIGVLSYAEVSLTEVVLLMAPFGATAVLVFGVPSSPLAQPKNVIIGHFITASIGIAFSQYVEITPITLAIATGLGVSAMLITKTTHPPVGANPILIMASGQGWSFLFTPVLFGAVVIVLVGKALQLLQSQYLNPRLNGQKT